MGMGNNNEIPLSSYGILKRASIETELDSVVEQVNNVGYAVLDPKFTKSQIDFIGLEFDEVLARSQHTYQKQLASSSAEKQTIRAMLTHHSDTFLNLALNDVLLNAVGKLIDGKFMLNQQNGLINPPADDYSQGKWHRDLPYQHFVSSSALAVNALYCVDDFTCENGATFVLPASHKLSALPSETYLKKNAIQVEAQAGSFIVLTCMTFHAGGVNNSLQSRRAVNHIFNIPFFKQQINLPQNLSSKNLTQRARELLGFTFIEPDSVEAYLSNRS